MNIEICTQVGQPKRISIGRATGALCMKAADNCVVSYPEDSNWRRLELDRPVDVHMTNDLNLQILCTAPSEQHVLLEYTPEDATNSQSIRIVCFAMKLQLSVDANRDGVVDENEIGSESWMWGHEQPGAIILVNNDRDFSDFHPQGVHQSELSPLLVHDPGINAMPPRYTLRLYCTRQAADRFSVYRVTDGQPEVVLGRTPAGEKIAISPPLEPRRQELQVEAHQFPHGAFEGLITIELQLVEEIPGGAHVQAAERAVMRVAPWVMTPNDLAPRLVYVCDVSTSTIPNAKFLRDISVTLERIGIPLHVVPPEVNGGDRWIQDEIEFGYSMGPRRALPVVFDSPRDRKLDGFPEATLLGPDFGHFQIGGSQPNSLDSFGNLEVSPPVTVNGNTYPLGRIIFGGKEYGTYRAASRRMMPELRQFLYAQKVQRPIEIYTDWLAVGHVDEILCFVPANNDIGFQLLLASPTRAYSILDELNWQGYDEAVLFQGRFRRNGKSAERTVGELISDHTFWVANNVFQKYMDHNRQVLIRELSIGDEHIVDIPVLFYPPSTQRTLAYFPDMVNQLVLGKYSLVPKPYGPVVHGVDQFERALEDALPERNVVFIEDWYSYHELSGEVHCGTNCLREPPAVKWWEHRPVGGFDV